MISRWNLTHRSKSVNLINKEKELKVQDHKGTVKPAKLEEKHEVLQETLGGWADGTRSGRRRKWLLEKLRRRRWRLEEEEEFWNQRMELEQGVRGQEQVLKEGLVRNYPSEVLHSSAWNTTKKVRIKMFWLSVGTFRERVIAPELR